MKSAIARIITAVGLVGLAVYHLSIGEIEVAVIALAGAFGSSLPASTDRNEPPAQS